MKSLTSLPDDVLINKILLKLDTKSLVNLRCVCKNLRSFITNPDFVKMHCNNNNNPLVLLVYGDKNLLCTLNFNGNEIDPSRPERVDIEIANPFSRSCRYFGSCNGLLCLVDRENSPPSLWNPTTKEYKDSPPSLWNPTTKEYKELPKPFPPPSSPFGSDPNIIFGRRSSGGVAYGIGYDRIIDDYKVIQCKNFIYRQYIPPPPDHNTEYTISTDFQVYTLGTDTWTRINDNPYKSYFTIRYHNKTTPGMMFVNGALHWVMRDEEEFFRSKIIAFDIEKEMFLPEVPKPHSRLSESEVYCNWSLHVLRGCLCIYERVELQRESPCIDVWMMKDYGVMESWTKLFTINYYHEYASRGLDFKVLNFCENGEVIFAKNYGIQELILYNPINKKSRTVNLGEIGGISYKEIHTESLVSLNTGIYR